MSESYFLARGRWSTKAIEAILYALIRIFRFATWPVPTWVLTGTCARLGGALTAAVPGLRRRAEPNLALVWPDMPRRERLRLVRAVGAAFTRLMVEYARVDKFVREVALEIEGAGHLESAHAAGNGVVLVTAHYGNWEAARTACLRLGIPSGIIYRPFNNRYLDAFTMRLIPCAGTPVLQKGRRGVRDLITHVASGGTVMILVDQRNSGAPFIDFLGHPAETATAAADVALRTGAALIPVRAARNVAARRFDVTFEPPVTGDDSEAMMAEVNRRIGVWVEQAPEQWFWFHRRWRQTIRSRPLPAGGEG